MPGGRWWRAEHSRSGWPSVSARQVRLDCGHVEALLPDALAEDLHGIGGGLAARHLIPDHREVVLDVVQAGAAQG